MRNRRTARVEVVPPEVVQGITVVRDVREAVLLVVIQDVVEPDVRVPNPSINLCAAVLVLNARPRTPTRRAGGEDLLQGTGQPTSGLSRRACSCTRP